MFNLAVLSTEGEQESDEGMGKERASGYLGPSILGVVFQQEDCFPRRRAVINKDDVWAAMKMAPAKRQKEKGELERKMREPAWA